MEVDPIHRPLTPDVTRLRDKPIQPAQPPHDSSVIMMFLRESCVFPRALCRLRRRGAVIRGDAHTVKTFLPGWCLRWEGKGPFQAAMSGPSPVQPRQVWGPPERPCLARWCTCEWTGAPPPLRVFFLSSGAPDPTTLTPTLKNTSVFILFHFHGLE